MRHVAPALLAIPGLVTRKHVSKHRQYDDDGRYIPGACRIGPATGLRKLMRAARRGLVPQERIFTITQAMRNAAARPASYYGGASARKAEAA